MNTMKAVDEKEYVAFIKSISEKGTVIPDPPTRVRREGAIQVVEYERAGKVVAQHCSALHKGDWYFIAAQN